MLIPPKLRITLVCPAILFMNNEQFCIKCGETKNIICFIGSICKSCKKQYLKNYYQKNKSSLKEKSRKYYLDNKDACKQSHKEYYRKNFKQVQDYYKKYNNDNRDAIIKKKELYRLKNRKTLNDKAKEYRASNPKSSGKYHKNRRNNDLNYKLRCNLSSRIRIALKHQNTNKSNNTITLLGCSIKEFRIYLERQFEEGMSWNNHGKFGWHMDHIKPCASFDLTDPKQQEECFHYSNYQPLWWNENLSKGAKVLI